MKNLIISIQLIFISTLSFALSPKHGLNAETDLLIKRLNQNFSTIIRNASSIDNQLENIHFKAATLPQLTYNWKVDGILAKITDLDSIIISDILDIYFSNDKDFPEIEEYLSSILRETILNAAEEGQNNDSVSISIFPGNKGILVKIINATLRDEKQLQQKALEEQQKIISFITGNDKTFSDLAEIALDLDAAETTVIPEKGPLIGGMGMRNLILFADDFFFTQKNNLIDSVIFRIDFANSLSSSFNLNEEVIIRSNNIMRKAA